MNAKGVYLKDVNGNVISPVTSTSTIYDSNGRCLETTLAELLEADALIQQINGEVL